MNGQRKTLLRIGASLLALVLFAAAPGVADAASIGFRNDTKSRIIVQGSTVVNGVLRKGPPITIDPGKTFYDVNVPLGTRHIVIVDGNQPNRVLGREVVPVANVNPPPLYSVRPAPTGWVHLMLVTGH